MNRHHQDITTGQDDGTTLDTRIRALDPSNFRARLAASGWTPAHDGRWRHYSGTTVALPDGTNPEDTVAAAATAAQAESRGLETFVASVERAHMDRYVFMPIGGPRTAGQLPTMAQAAAFADALDSLVGSAARYGSGFYPGGAAQALTLTEDILVAPVPGEAMATELAVPSPLEPDAPRFGVALTASVEAIADPPADHPRTHVLEVAAGRLASCARRAEADSMIVLIIPNCLRDPRDQGRALRIPAA